MFVTAPFYLYFTSDYCHCSPGRISRGSGKIFMTERGSEPIKQVREPILTFLFTEREGSIDSDTYIADMERK